MKFYVIYTLIIVNEIIEYMITEICTELKYNLCIYDITRWELNPEINERLIASGTDYGCSQINIRYTLSFMQLIQ